LTEITGSNAWRTDDSHASATNTIPVNNIFFAFQIENMLATLLTGVYVDFRVKMLIEFYEPKNLSSFYRMLSQAHEDERDLFVAKKRFCLLESKTTNKEENKVLKKQSSQTRVSSQNSNC